MEVNDGTMKLPMVALRGLVIFPYTVLNFEVGREVSQNAIERATESDRLILLVAQRDMRVETPTPKDLYEIGVTARIRHIIKVPNGTSRVMVEGLGRARILDYINEDCYMAVAEDCERDVELDENAEAHMRLLISKFETLSGEAGTSAEAISALSEMKSPAKLVDTIAMNLLRNTEDKQEVLETLDVIERYEKVLAFADKEANIAALEREVAVKTRKNLDKTQRDYYLKEQLRVIQGELEDGEADGGDELERFAQAIEVMPVDQATKEKLRKDLKHLKQINPQMADYNVLLTYLEWVTSLPYGTFTTDNMDLLHARKVLDEDHYGMEKVKDRIIEYLAVTQLKKNMKGPILCFAGPPGVGKTSIARSIAKAVGRKFVRMSLGGVQDEAEIRGHRRTYVGAIPGRIVSNIKKAGTMNPVFLLDEIDKMGKDYKGDPASAMLEVLDGEINSEFQDHYLDMDFDLSNVMFITTANDVSAIPAPLFDRMEVIEISGYTAFEKRQIARRHLIPKQLEENGLRGDVVEITDDAIDKMVSGYTMESGVRTLERTIGTVCRKAARAYIEGEEHISVGRDDLDEYLGAEKFTDTLLPDRDTKGIAVGLAWTAYGGTVLPVEAIEMEGTGELVLTGQLGDVMKESALAGKSLIFSMADELGIDEKKRKKCDIHLHAPEGAVSKDGPSAGITMALAMASALSGRKIRHDYAMTGEITLSGRVLPIGGLKEKSLAAVRYGINKVIIPKGNVKDIEEIPEEIAKEIEFIPVEMMSDVIKTALKGKRQ